MSKKQKKAAKKAAKKKAKKLEKRIAEARARYLASMGKSERVWVPFDLRPHGRTRTPPRERPGGWMPYGVVYEPPPMPYEQRPDPIEL